MASPQSAVDRELARAERRLGQAKTLSDTLTAVYAGLMAVRHGPGRELVAPLWLLSATCDVLEAVAKGASVSAGGRHGRPTRRALDLDRDLFRHRLITELLAGGNSKNAACREAAQLLRETPRMVEQAYDRVRKNPTRYADVSPWDGYLL